MLPGGVQCHAAMLHGLGESRPTAPVPPPPLKQKKKEQKNNFIGTVAAADILDTAIIVLWSVVIVLWSLPQIFLIRHGEGEHNAAERRLGTEFWEAVEAKACLH